MTEPKPRRYGWRLAALMGENKVRTGTELHRLLAEKGYEITSSQLSRIIYERPTQVKTALLDALGEVFGCTLDELMPLLDPTQRKPDKSEQPPPKAPRKRIRAKPAAAASTSDDEMGGPVVRPFPIPKK
jgi:hypothetical protein